MHFVLLLARGLLSGVLGLIGISPRCPRLDVSMRLCQPALVVLELPGLLTAQMYEGSSLKFGLSAREEADKITNKQMWDKHANYSPAGETTNNHPYSTSMLPFAVNQPQ